MIKILTCIIVALFSIFNLFAQNDNSQNKVYFGLEQDIVSPIFLNGSKTDLWTGKDHVKYKISFSVYDLPEFMKRSNVRFDRQSLISFSTEYYTNKNLEGFLFGVGFGFCQNIVNSKNIILINKSFVSTLNSGYKISFTNWLYCSANVALQSRLIGNEEINFGNLFYKPIQFTPELSLKIAFQIPVSIKNATAE